MWVRVGTFLVKEGSEMALSSTYHERATPLVRATPGNRGALLLQPVQPGEPFIVMTLWETRADGDAYEASGTAAEVVGLVRPYFAGPPTLRSYESSGAL